MKRYKWPIFLFLGILLCILFIFVYNIIFSQSKTEKDSVTQTTSTTDIDEPNDTSIQGSSTNLQKIRCKHGRYKRFYSRNDPKHPRNRGYFTLNDFIGTSIKEGYSPLQSSSYIVSYNNSNLQAPFNNGINPNSDPTFLTAANTSSNIFATNLAGAYNEVNNDECSVNCDHTSCCNTLAEVNNTTNVVNIDFDTNPVPGNLGDANGLYQLFCSANPPNIPNTNTPYYDYGATMYSVNQYNDNTLQYYNACMQNQDQMVQNMCSTAQSNLNNFSNNIQTSASTFQGNIISNIQGGTINGAGQNWNQSHQQIGNILTAMQGAWSNCNTTNAEILGEAINNCVNGNTSITQDGSGNLQCGVNGLQETAIQQINTALLSTQNPLVNDIINTNILYSDLSYVLQSDYGLTPLQTIQSNLTSNITFADNLYNNCSNPNTRLDPNGVIECASDEYTKAYQSCQAAIEISSVAGGGGNTAINQYWIDISNNLTYADYSGNAYNNIISNVEATLQTANQYCTNEINKYNSWKTDQDIAANIPCIPEQSIEPGWNSTLTGYVTDWSNAALTYLNTLNAELDQILADLSGTPQNALTLTNNSIQNAPYGTLPSFTITGPPLNQILNIIVPSGAPGLKGLDGTVPGDHGNKGYYGSQGPSGPAGIWEIPVQYSSNV